MDDDVDPGASFTVDESHFRKGKVRVDVDGVELDGRRRIGVDPASLDFGDRIGKGASSYVQLAVHRPTGRRLAIKVINMFEKAKRSQLMSEITALYDANCRALVKFYGAFYKEGAINIAIEYMDMGGLDALPFRVPEAALANMTYQVLWGLCYLKHGA